MNRFLSRLRPALAALVVLLPAASVAVAGEVPFYSEATLALGGSQGNHYTREGSGQATYLGEFAEVNLYKAKGKNGYYGIATLTGADGDSLVIQWVNAPVGDNHYEGVYLIIGGTGQFEGATGEGTMSVDVNPEDGTTYQVFDGTIDL